MRTPQLRTVIAGALVVTLIGLGWLLASSTGKEFLRRDFEARLGALLVGEVGIPALEFEFHDGLALRGFDVSVYPANDGPGLRAREVYVELNEAALLVGDFRLARLEIDDLAVRVQLDASGTWQFPPLRALQQRSSSGVHAGPEARLLLGAVDAVARTLMTTRSIADRVSLRGGSVRFEDREESQGATAARGKTSPGNAALAGLTVRLEDVAGDLSRPWPFGDAAISLSGTLIDPNEKHVPMAIRGSADRDGEVSLALSALGLDLDVLDRYTSRLGGEANLDGSLGATLAFTSSVGTDLRETQSLDVDLALDGVVSRFSAGGKPLRLLLPISKIALRIEMDPDTVRLVDATATGKAIRIGVDATVARPFAADSLARVSLEIGGASMDDVSRLLGELPEDTRAALGIWFDPVKSGHFDQLGIRGSAPLSQWEALARGELASLPDGFLLNFQVSDLTAEFGDGAHLENASFHATWTEQQLELAEARGTFEGEPLPVLSATIFGLERFLEAERAPRSGPAPEVDGASYLWEFVSTAGGDRAEDPEAGDPRNLEVDLAFLDHPLIQWPLEDAKILVEPLAHGTQITVERGTWAGVPIHGKAVYLEESERRLSVSLTAEPGQQPAPGLPGAERERAGRASEERASEDGVSEERARDESAREGVPAWARGSFVLTPAEYDPTPAAGVLSFISGDFTLRESRLAFNEVNVAIGPTATARIELAFDLAKPDEFGLALDAQLEDAQVADVSDALGLPAGFITGSTSLDTVLGGVIRRGEREYAGVTGSVSFVAKHGEIRKAVPVIVALATATDGFNPISSMSAMQYDSIVCELFIENGIVRADRFELEGPVRVYASGTLDFGPEPPAIEGVIGVFLFQRAREVLGMVPLVNLVVPGSDKGMVGAYFALGGSWEEPHVSTMKMKSLTEQLPGIITKPFELLRSLMKPGFWKKPVPTARAGANP